MPEQIAFELVEHPDSGIVQVLEAGLDAYNSAASVPPDVAPFALLLKDSNDVIVGGVFAVAYWSGLAIDLVWIADAYRGSGYGGQLLERVEMEGRRRGANKAFLNTHTFQAPGFYEKHGYELYGELKDFPPGYDRRYYVKTLIPLD